MSTDPLANATVSDPGLTVCEDGSALIAMVENCFDCPAGTTIQEEI